MCDPISVAIVGSTIIGASAAQKEGEKQRKAMERQAKEAERLQKEQQAKFDLEKRKAEAVPTLLRNEAQRTRSPGIKGLKVSKGSDSGYSSMGTGGATATGINIPKG